MITQEKNYFVIPYEGGRLAFAITARKTKEQTPAILYAGGEHALFHRNEEETVILDYLDNRARKMLLTTKGVAVIEIDPKTEKMVRQYPVLLKIVDKLPEFDLEQKASK